QHRRADETRRTLPAEAHECRHHHGDATEGRGPPVEALPETEEDEPMVAARPVSLPGDRARHRDHGDAEPDGHPEREPDQDAPSRGGSPRHGVAPYRRAPSRTPRAYQNVRATA